MKSKPPLIRKTWPKIRIITVRGQEFYQVDGRRKGTNGKQESFSTKGEAEKRAGELAGEFQREGNGGLEMPADLRVFALKADEILRPYGKSLLQAAEHYKGYLDSLLTKENSRLISELAEEWLNDKKSGNKRKLREHTLLGILKGAEFLKRHFGQKRILELTPKDIQQVFDGMPVGLQTKFNINALISQFFNWSIAKEYCTTNPADKLEFIPESRESITILAPERAKAFMVLCESKYPALTLYHAICLFAGLRPNECLLLKWEDIHIAQKFIHVRKETSKVKESRNVPIEPNLLEWLKAYEGERKGFVTAQTNFFNTIKKYRNDLGYKITLHKRIENGNDTIWEPYQPNQNGPTYPQDVTRHSYASYWLVKYKDRPHLAENMGNSPDMVKKHYKEVVSRGATNAYWAIVPASTMLKGRKARASNQSTLERLTSKLK